LCRLNSVGVNSIEDAYWFEDLRTLEEVIGQKILPMWTRARQSLPTGIGPLERLKTNLWTRIVNLDHQSIWNTWGKETKLSIHPFIHSVLIIIIVSPLSSIEELKIGQED